MIRQVEHQTPAVDRRGDEVTFGVHLSFLSAELVEFVGTLGFRWLFLDAQRTPLDLSCCRELVRAAEITNMFCVVRVAEISVPTIEGYLDAGVLGILAPNISSAAQARALVSAVKFSPEGTRGAAFKSRSARYGLTQSHADFCRAANHATFTAALIECQSGLDELEAIAAVPGVDYLSIGANDLALSLGMTAGGADSRARALVEEANARIKAIGKPQIAVVGNAEQAQAAIAAGARLVAVSDAALLATAGRSLLEVVGG
jgi:4-hydroxy-2-oxoheptanedioate aldolase